MFLELLIASSCIADNNSCGYATSAYYKSSQELQDLAKKIEQEGERIVHANEWVIWTATPMYAIASGQVARFNVYKNTTLGLNVKNPTILIELNY